MLDSDYLSYKNLISELEKRRNEISTIVTNMDSDDITNTFSDYLKRRNKGNH